MVNTARTAAGADEGPAVERSLRTILSRVDGGRARFSTRGTSATLAGLTPEVGRQGEKPLAPASDDMVFAVQEIPAHATSVNPETGAIGWDEEASHQDPIGHQEFDTPEFAESAEGWTQESENLYEEVLRTGEHPAVDPEVDP